VRTRVKRAASALVDTLRIVASAEPPQVHVVPSSGLESARVEDPETALDSAPGSFSSSRASVTNAQPAVPEIAQEHTVVGPPGPAVEAIDADAALNADEDLDALLFGEADADLSPDAALELLIFGANDTSPGTLEAPDTLPG
jgi:hypothetical protein